MDDTTLKVALACLLHDIGKLVERAGFDVGEEYFRSNADIFLPFRKQEGRHTHRHALHTAWFIERHADLLPVPLRSGSWGDGDSLERLAAGHHRPETALQWVVTKADWLSAGLDRQAYDLYDEEVGVRQHLSTRMIPVIATLGDGEAGSAPPWRLPLQPARGDHVFPVPHTERGRDESVAEYRALFDGFVAQLGTLAHRDESVSLWGEHFGSLLAEYTAHVPSTSVGNVAHHDVSLYDHCLTTAALATALYRYHASSGSLELAAVQDDLPEKFLLVGADFHGIQDFIFSEGGESGKGRARMLRGRSFMVGLLTDLAAHRLCEVLGLPWTSVVLNAAGRFTLVAPNTPEASAAVGTVAREVETWFHQRFYGECGMSLAATPAAPRDFVKGGFQKLWERLGAAMEHAKFTRFGSGVRLGAIAGYHDTFHSDLNPPLCPWCGRRPSTPGAMPALAQGARDSCGICHDQVFIGREVVAREQRLAVVRTDARVEGLKLLEPLYGHYQVFFPGGDLSRLARDGILLRHWEIGIETRGGSRVARREAGGYVPLFSETDLDEDVCPDYRDSESSEDDIFDQVKPGGAKSFHHLACGARVRDPGTGQTHGLAALGVLKADVDRLGELMAGGLGNRLTFSRLATLSRQINTFFAAWVPRRLALRPEFSDIYTVFAGGDDLFVIGPWNRVTDFALDLRERFQAFGCDNPKITLSAGMSLHRPGEPLRVLAASAESALHASKTMDDGKRNRFTAFGETVSWDRMPALEEIRAELEEWIGKKWLSRGMLYRLNALQEMAGRERLLRAAGSMTLEDVGACLWRSRFRYTIARNAARGLPEVERGAAIAEMQKIAVWLDKHSCGLKLPLWRILYELR